MDNKIPSSFMSEVPAEQLAAKQEPALRPVESLTHEEVRAARLAIAEIIFTSPEEMPRVLEEKRITLATSLVCSAGTIRSATAYVRYWATKVLQEHTMPNLSRDDIVSAWYYLEVTQTEQAQQQRDAWEGIDDLVDHFANRGTFVTREQLQTVVAAYRSKIAQHETKSKRVSSSPSLIPEARPTTIPLDVSVNAVAHAEKNVEADEDRSTDNPKEVITPGTQVSPVSGATFNYDNPEKNDWRSSILMKYVCEKIPLEQRHGAKVLCLGGRMNLEPRAYIEHGFTPANITSVECDDRVKDEFLATGSALGIRTNFGKLRDMFSSEKFHVISIDYTGPAGIDKMIDAETIVPADDAIVVMNFQAKRDTKSAKKMSSFHEVAHDAFDEFNPAGSRMDAAASSISRLRELFEAEPTENDKVERHDWTEKRKRNIIRILSQMGNLRHDQALLKGFPALEKIFRGEYLLDCKPDTLPDPHEFLLSQKFAQQLYSAFTRHYRVDPPGFVADVGACAMVVLSRLFTCSPLLKEVRFESYKSKRNDQSNPFITACAQLSIPRKLYVQHLRTLQALASVANMMADEQSPGKLLIREEMVVKKVLMLPMPKCITWLVSKCGSNEQKVELEKVFDAIADFQDIDAEHVRLLLFGTEGASPIDPASTSVQQVAAMGTYFDQVLEKAKRAANKLVGPRYRTK